MIILLVEDEVDLAELTIEFLDSENIDCDYANNGQQAIQLIKDHSYDAIVLDINLPQKNGFDVCQEIRDQGISTPCLMLTARDSLDDRLEGFKRGTDDYMIKPFAMEELCARLHALYRRSHPSSSAPMIIIGNLSINISTREAARNNRTLELTPIGWRLLQLLAQSSPSIVSRNQLEDHGWPHEDVSKDAFKMQLYRLRQQLSQQGESALLHTIRGVGFCLKELT
ncbi:two-component system response regulator [Gammaproteobacteria bacterium 45_16_T64]|nr:two-component system response regulator [Gammaproteobacteria bacterium 45_16_T64]